MSVCKYVFVIVQAIAAAFFVASTISIAAPPPVVGGPLLSEITAMPAGEWKRINRNLFSDVWTPVDLRAGTQQPFNIIDAWSGFAWDSRRGDLILYGGGHANYPGNEVYRWRSSSMSWERASLPSEITAIFGSAAYMAIDGADAAPGSAHTYDNNIYLPIVDRFMTWGGALYNTAGTYLRPDEFTAGAIRSTGPYLFDPSRADGNKVGGTTGSHVKRFGAHPEIVGGNMWQNRDHPRNIPTHPRPSRYVNGCTAYAEENGKDVVYVAGHTGTGSSTIKPMA